MKNTPPSGVSLAGALALALSGVACATPSAPHRNRPAHTVADTDRQIDAQVAAWLAQERERLAAATADRARDEADLHARMAAESARVAEVSRARAAAATQFGNSVAAATPADHEATVGAPLGAPPGTVISLPRGQNIEALIAQLPDEFTGNFKSPNVQNATIGSLNNAAKALVNALAKVLNRNIQISLNPKELEGYAVYTKVTTPNSNDIACVVKLSPGAKKAFIERAAAIPLE